MSDPLVAHRAGGHRSADHSNTTDSSFSCYVEDHFRGAIEFLRSRRVLWSFFMAIVLLTWIAR